MAHGKPQVVIAHLPLQQSNATARLLTHLQEQANIVRKATEQPRIVEDPKRTAYVQGKLDVLDGLVFAVKNGHFG